MQKITRKFFILCICLLAFINCKHKIDPNAEAGSYEDFYSYVKIYPAPGEIIGHINANALVYSGVFVKDRNVKLSPYNMAKTEVTYKLWEEVYDWATEHNYRFKNKGYKGSKDVGNENQPVTNISWIDAVVWCNAYTEMKKGVSQCVYYNSKTDLTILKDATDSTKWKTVYFNQSKKGYRLPTEAEWEYAARWQGKDNTNADGYGNAYLTNLNSASGAKEKSAEESSNVAWYNRTNTGTTMEVGTKRKNTLGIYDMSGNVWEYCFDFYVKKPAKGDFTNPIGPISGSQRTVRGGGYQCIPKNIYVGARFPCDHDQLIEKNVWGFRLVWN